MQNAGKVNRLSCVCGLIWDVIKKKTTYSFAQLVARIIYFVIDILFACDIMQLKLVAIEEDVCGTI